MARQFYSTARHQVRKECREGKKAEMMEAGVYGL